MVGKIEKFIDKILDKGERLKPITEFLKSLKGVMIIILILIISTIPILYSIGVFKSIENKEVEKIALTCFDERNKDQDRFYEDLQAIQIKKILNKYIVKLKTINLVKTDGSKKYPREYCVLIYLDENKDCMAGTYKAQDCKKSPFDFLPELKLVLFEN